MQADKTLKLKTPPTEASKEAVAALKAQLEMELHNLKQCAYKAYECTQLTLEGYNYCLRHILQDKNAPYKQCAYMYNSNGKRCCLPALKENKKDSTGYCNEHALKAHLIGSRRGTRCQPPRTAEVLLHSVSHYIKKPRTRTLSSSTQHSDEGRSTPDDSNDGLVTKSLDPFADVDANSILASGSDVLDMCSDSESDVDASSYGSVWHDAHADSSDNDSIDSEHEDVLKHANIYSAEEVTLITRDKLIRLQSLYINHFRYLHHMLRERRRRYLHALKREKETYCSIYNQIHNSTKEQRLYKKLKAYNSYHRKHGDEAICHKRSYERRLKATEGVTLKPPSFSKCIFTEGGVKCGERTLPVTRHCRKHILEDPNQVLFRSCSKMRGDMECTTPVEAIFDDATCRLHMDIPPIRSYSQIRKDSESDYDDFTEANAPSTSAGASETIVSVKTKNIGNVLASANVMDISNTNIDSLNDKTISTEIQDSLKASDFISDHTDIEMSLANTEQIRSRFSDEKVNFDSEACLGFSDTENVLAISDPENIEYPTDNNMVTSDLEINTDSVVTSEISSVGDSVVDTEMSTSAVSPTVTSNIKNHVELECNTHATNSSTNEMKSDNQISTEAEKI